MRQIVRVVCGITVFTLLAALLALRIAVAAVLAVITPIVMPVLALLSCGGLLVAIGFACAGHWHDAAKGLWACFVCTLILAIFAGIARLINPGAFAVPVVMLDRTEGGSIPLPRFRW